MTGVLVVIDVEVEDEQEVEFVTLAGGGTEAQELWEQPPGQLVTTMVDVVRDVSTWPW